MAAAVERYGRLDILVNNAGTTETIPHHDLNAATFEVWGRRTVVTSLFVDGHEALEDVARFVGHAKPSTTAGYVKRLGRRPEAVARRAAQVLDAHAEGDSPTA